MPLAAACVCVRSDELGIMFAADAPVPPGTDDPPIVSLSRHFMYCRWDSILLTKVITFAMAKKPLESLHTSLKEYFNVETFSDATVTCKGRAFKVHRLILSAQSDFFAKVFTGDWKC